VVNFNIKFDYTLRREISKTVPPTTVASELGNILTVGEATVSDVYSRQGSIKANVAYTEPGTGTSYTYIYPFIMLTTSAQVVPITTLGEITRDYLPGRGTFIRTVDTTDFMGKNTDPLDNVYGNYSGFPLLSAKHFYEIPIFDVTISSAGLVTSGQILTYNSTSEDWTDVAATFNGSIGTDPIGAGSPWLWLQTASPTALSPYRCRVTYQIFDSAEIAEREALSRKYEVEQFIENYNRIHNNDYSSMEGAYSANANFQTYTV